MEIDKLDHLLSVLRDQCFIPLEVSVPLVSAEADPASRDHMVMGPHQDWEPVAEATVWGRPQSYFWFGGSLTVPPQLAGQRLYLWLEAAFGRVMGRSDPQCLIRINGEIVQGGDFNHREVLLTSSAEAGQVFDILIEAGTIEDRRQLGFGVELMAHDPDLEALYFDLKTPLDVARHLPENDHRRDAIMTRVYAALNAVDLRIADGARRAESVRVAKQIADEIYAIADTEARPDITVVGHTHIDVAWLWRVRETRQKMARSMATALTLMDEYPEYTFTYNQGYLLDTLSKDYPALFDRLRDQNKAGRFEIEGALWLEPDANMTSGESLIRHITKGIRYHQDTFGVTPKVVWLPDTFGYSAALPQLMKLSGLEVFVTHKMSWNDTNRIPNETFWWQGLDGTKVPTYFLTTQPMESTTIGTTYCPDIKASHVMGTWRRYAQKAQNDKLFLVYGHGDGGGGPTREMLEHLRRMERGIPGCPKVTHGHMGPFLDGVVGDMRQAPAKFPTWVGELYLEFHRGTFTSVAEVKANNRRAEAAMRSLEALAVHAMVQGVADYPVQDFSALWDVVLLNQFHDILPGSSIGLVYEDSRADFVRFFEQAEALERRLADALGGRVVLNPTGTDQSGLVKHRDGQTILRADGETETQQFVVADAAGIGAVAADPTGRVVATEASLENDILRAEFDEAGRLISLTDKRTARQVLSGPANALRAYRDHPAQFDAWDIDKTFEDQSWPIEAVQSIRVVEQGPYRAAIRFEWGYESSRFVQVVSLVAGAAVVEFDTFVDWQENNTLVKAAFPTNLRTDASVAEVQFGHVARPSHQNTSWDQARFECPMHRWVAMHEAGQGIAILNDGKYGYDAKGANLRISLLRSPTWPWPEADIGEHKFRYGVMLFQELAEVPPVAEAFNAPLRSIGTGAPVEIDGLITLGSDAIALEAIKKADDGSDIILRLWDRSGGRQVVSPRFASQVVAFAECDLLEQPTEDWRVVSDAQLVFAPFEIKTLRLRWEAA